jgi:hypothetical protein
VDVELAALIQGGAAAGVDRLLLGVMDRARLAASRAPDRPPVLVRDYVLIALCHRNLPS